jgi:ribosomal protein S18 acetylase RimI-like enzyme
MAEVEHVPYWVATCPARDDDAVEVRPLQRDEYELLRSLRLQMLEDAPDAFTITVDSERGKPNAWWRDRLAATVNDPNRIVLVAEVDGDAVASVLGVIDAFDTDLAHLYALWVAPSARRAGTATALVNAICDWARERGAHTIELSVTIGNDPACNLYKRQGFTDTGEREPLRAGSPLKLMKMRATL